MVLLCLGKTISKLPFLFSGTDKIYCFGVFQEISVSELGKVFLSVEPFVDFPPLDTRSLSSSISILSTRIPRPKICSVK